MKFSIHSLAIETFVPMLRTLSELLDKGAEHARAAKIEPAALVGARLAPDMYPLSKQVELACHHAEDTTARLLGKEPPRLGGDGEDGTIEALKARIARTIDHLQKVKAGAFEGAEDRDVEMALQGDMVLALKGHELLMSWGLPHFYFHVVTAYDILRHEGVEIGKRDYLSQLGPYVRRGGGARG